MRTVAPDKAATCLRLYAVAFSFAMQPLGKVLAAQAFAELRLPLATPFGTTGAADT